MKLRSLLLASLLLMLVFGVRLLGTATLGLQSDEGVHIVAASQVAEGQVLYLDLFENRTPGFEWLLAGLFRLSGTHWFIGRGASVLLATLTAAALLKAGHIGSKGQGGAGFLAVLLFALAPLAIFWSRFAMLESLETAAAALAIVFALMALTRKGFGLWVIAGIFSGLAILAKQSGIVLLPVMVLVLLYSRKSKGLILYLAGVSGLLGLFLLILWGEGALSYFWRYLSGADRLDLLNNLPAKGVALWGWARQQPILPLTVLGILILPKRTMPRTWLVLLWGMAEFGALLLPPEADFEWGGFSHYVLPALAAGSLVGSIGVTYIWQSLRGERRYILMGAGILLLLLLSGSGWLQALNRVIWQSTYPQPDMVDEKQIGRVVSLITESEDPVVVLGNSGFYYWADRRPASKFFHFPAYLKNSTLLPEVEADLQQVLMDSDSRAVLISRMHLEERLTPKIVDAIEESWVPAVRFDYEYQRDMFLYLRPSRLPPEAEPVARFADGVNLLAVEVQMLDETNLLVELTWQADHSFTEDETVFVHILRPDGTLAAQHDGVPTAGFRPTTSWQPGEYLSDWHWIRMPLSENRQSYLLSIGLYNSVNNSRRLLQGEQGEENSYLVPLFEVITE